MDYINSYRKLTNAADEILNRSRGDSPAKQKAKGLLARPEEEETEFDLEALDPETIAAGYMAKIKEMFSDEDNINQIKSYLAESETPEEFSMGDTRPKGRGEVPQGEVPDYIYNGLVERGMPEHIARGFLMNMQDESAFKPTVEEYSPNVYGTRGKGLYQLTNDRREAYEKINGNDWSIDTQLDWLMTEWETTEKSAAEKIMATSTPQEAGAAIVTHFLRPAKEHRESRVQKYLNATGYTPS